MIPESGTLTDAILYLDGITVSFDGFKALNELSLLVEKGELRTIIGPNGAGKTTMMDVITGKTRPQKGTALFGGKPVRKARSNKHVKRGPRVGKQALAANPVAALM